MGEWYDYKISLVAKETGLAKMYIDSGLAVREFDERRGDSLALNLVKISEAAECDDDMKKILSDFKDNDGNPLQSMHVGLTGEEDDSKRGIFYVHKWCPNWDIAEITSKLFPNEILDICEYAPYGDEARFYMKNGQVSNRAGEPVQSIMCVKSTQIKELSNGNFKISFPIGDDADKWGSIILPPENIARDPTTVLLGKKDYTVNFRTHSEVIPAREIFERVKTAREEYRQKMSEPIYIEGLNRNDFLRTEHTPTGWAYRIARFPVEKPNGEVVIASIARSESECDESRGKLYLGAAGKKCSLFYIKDDGSREKTEEYPKDILAYREAYLRSREEEEELGL